MMMMIALFAYLHAVCAFQGIPSYVRPPPQPPPWRFGRDTTLTSTFSSRLLRFPSARATSVFSASLWSTTSPLAPPHPSLSSFLSFPLSFPSFTSRLVSNCTYCAWSLPLHSSLVREEWACGSSSLKESVTRSKLLAVRVHWYRVVCLSR